MGDALPITEPVHPSSDAIGSQVAASGATAGLPSRAGAADALALSGSSGPHAAPAPAAISSPLTTTQSPAKKPRRRFRQFGLRTLLLLMALCAAAFARYSHEIGRYKRQAAAIDELQLRGYSVDIELFGPKWLQEFVGEGLLARVNSIERSIFPLDDFREGDLALFDDILNAESIDLSSCRLTDRGLRHLERLSRLEKLDLMSTDVTDSGVARLRDLAQLQALNLADTNITDASLEVLSRMPNLVYLNLGDTQVDGQGLRHLSICTKLECLSLTRTAVTDETLRFVAGLAELKELNLAGTLVSDDGLAHLKALTKLERLELDNSNATGTGLKHLSGMKELTMLGLSGTPIEGPGLESLRVLKRVEGLNLSATRLTDDGLRFLGEVTHLKLLDMSSTQIKGSGLRHLAGLSELKMLILGARSDWLRYRPLPEVRPLLDDAGFGFLPSFSWLDTLSLVGAPVGDEALRVIRERLPALEQLQLEGTRVSDVGMPQLAAMPVLWSVDLTGTQVTDTGIMALVTSPKLVRVHCQETAITEGGIKAFDQACQKAGKSISIETATEP